jgi:hypothetical protein
MQSCQKHMLTAVKAPRLDNSAIFAPSEAASSAFGFPCCADGIGIPFRVAPPPAPSNEAIISSELAHSEAGFKRLAIVLHWPSPRNATREFDSADRG